MDPKTEIKIIHSSVGGAAEQLATLIFFLRREPVKDERVIHACATALDKLNEALSFLHSAQESLKGASSNEPTAK